LWLYAVAGTRPRPLPSSGAGGEPLRALRTEGDAWVIAGERDRPLPLSPAMVRAHDATVRALCARVAAVLPVRFGALVADEEELRRRLEPQTAALRDALALVAGREQMILRAFGDPSPPAAAPRSQRSVDKAAGPGARYLAARARELARAAAVPEIDPLRATLGPLVRAERAERHARPPLLASVYHLVDKGSADAYRAAVDEAARALDSASVRVRVSGPWPAWAFAPEPER
jgi:hypothetical protein